MQKAAFGCIGEKVFRSKLASAFYSFYFIRYSFFSVRCARSSPSAWKLHRHVFSQCDALAKFNVQPTTRQMKKNAAFLTSTMEQTISAKKWFSKIGNFIRSGLGIILITTIYLGDFFGIVQIFQSQMYPFKDSYLGNIN